jgi:hypothetical protein
MNLLTNYINKTGIAGAITDFCVTPNHVITVGLDRMLRVFEASGRRSLIKQIFLKQRLTSVACIEASIDDVWDDIPNVDTCVSDHDSDSFDSSKLEIHSGLKRKR